ncbi:hypothetical protein CPB83DRAFT_893942 [Crepidotus variabilis]|uniref:J domain-containing protein n=1 Tax=Crepidotus variabilis TaxID=179855 RepID=A0A9P6EH61_9AGAR|nr:hypothetical protein CPB83DRAFT_893942 [Crepidotus variabilis]
MLRLWPRTSAAARPLHPRPGSGLASSSGNKHLKDQGEKSTRKLYPYPLHLNPTPHQIFHLPFGASKQEIKTRYYELVRTHHPDSAHAVFLSPDIAHERFRSIKAAYDFLCGRTLSPHPNARPTPSPKNFDPYLHELSQRRRAYYASRGAYKMHEDGSEGWAKPGWGDGFAAPKNQQREWNPEGRRERLLLTFGVITLVAGLFPTLPFTLATMFMPVDPTTSQPSPSSLLPRLVPDLDKTHRAAGSALAQARQDRTDIGAERRDNIRRRVQEMNGQAEATESKVEDST